MGHYYGHVLQTCVSYKTQFIRSLFPTLHSAEVYFFMSHLLWL